VRLFGLDLTATQCAELTSCFAAFDELDLPVDSGQYERVHSPLCGELEADESYFGPRRVRGQRGRGAFGKTIVFDLLKRGDCVYTEIVPDATKATLQAIIRGKADISSVIHTDGWRGYHGLIDIGFDKHFRRVCPRQAAHQQHQVVLELRQGHTFELHLKECELRFNHRHKNLYQALLSLLKTNPL